MRECSYPDPALRVDKRDVVHFDGERTLDVRLTKELTRRRRAHLKSDRRVKLRAGTSDWLEVELQCDSESNGRAH